jgi:MOSC domain-containing protein YiiM
MMKTMARRIDSSSVGDPVRFRSLPDLERGLRGLGDRPTDDGRVGLIVRRGDDGIREVLDGVTVTPETGIPGDSWARRTPTKPEMQIAVMQSDVAELIANGQPLALFGDGLFLDFDLSAENLPEGSRVRIGEATLEVTPQPHDGCLKFRARFGEDALRFVSKPDLRHRNLRGIYMRVLEAGRILPGDAVSVLFRNATAVRDRSA